MKVVQINIFPNLSTGNIMMNIHNYIKEEGIESYVVWGRGRKAQNEYEIFMNDEIGVYLHGIYTRFTDKTGFASKRATKKLLKRLDEIKPDIVHLHNIHGYYINIEMLFNYLKSKNLKVIWTLHDCWAFTGHCAYFDSVNCEKWKTKCEKCPLIGTYPISYKDNSTWNYNKKKELFNELDLNIVTPSKWLAELTKKSFLNSNNIEIINNGINTDIFKVKENNLKEQLGLTNEKIILGVASTWDKRKGLEDFIKLSKVIPDNIKIILIGLSEKQIKSLPDNIIGLGRTKSVEQLVDFYNIADLYYNPTYSDNFPTTNIEALSCNTPVITYNTGGSPELINNENGQVVNLENMLNNYEEYLNKEYHFKDSKNYSFKHMAECYLELYKKVLYK